MIIIFIFTGKVKVQAFPDENWLYDEIRESWHTGYTAFELIKKADETSKMFPNMIKENVKETIPNECQNETFGTKNLMDL